MSLDKIKSISEAIKAKSVELDQAIYEYQQTIPAKGEAQPVVEAAPAPVEAPQTPEIAPTATPAPEPTEATVEPVISPTE